MILKPGLLQVELVGLMELREKSTECAHIAKMKDRDSGIEEGGVLDLVELKAVLKDIEVDLEVRSEERVGIRRQQ